MMNMTLEQLLKSIDPAVVAEEISARADGAINSFPMNQGLITQWEEFKTIMSKFVAHLDSVILRLYTPREVNFDHDWGYACRMLMKLYGGNGEKTAFELARTGNEGGLYRVFKDVAQQIMEEYTQNEIRAKINHYWDSLHTSEKFNAIDEYLSHYGHLLPSELTEGSAARIKANFPKVLEEHTQMMQRLKRIGN
jgi:hypothetical protein